MKKTIFAENPRTARELLEKVSSETEPYTYCLDIDSTPSQGFQDRIIGMLSIALEEAFRTNDESLLTDVYRKLEGFLRHGYSGFTEDHQRFLDLIESNVKPDRPMAMLAAAEIHSHSASGLSCSSSSGRMVNGERTMYFSADTLKTPRNLDKAIELLENAKASLPVDSSYQSRISCALAEFQDLQSNQVRPSVKTP